MNEIFHTKNLITKDRIEEEIFLHKQMDMKNIKNLDKCLIEAWKEDSLAAEQYRILRTYILKTVKNNGSKIFLISSAVHSEEKTLTVTNLAISIAMGLDESVLVIDADLRKQMHLLC